MDKLDLNKERSLTMFFFVIMRKFVRVGEIPSMCHVDVSDLLYGLSHALRKSPYVIYSGYGQGKPVSIYSLKPTN